MPLCAFRVPGPFALILLIALAVVAGCQPSGRRPIATRLPLVPGDPPTLVPPGVTLSGPFPADTRGLRPQRHVLAVSSGGLYGAYSTGFLAGWSKTGTRPEFDTVTGVSVGSLIAPYAFLGEEFDGVAMDLYTGVRAEDVFRIRAWVTIPFKDAVASSAPLKNLIESQITPAVLARIAAEHRKGRRLYVGTTSLTTRRPVIWDMGAIATLPDGAGLFRDVLLASCSVPGMLPPVMFAMPAADGCVANELHADGGVTTQLFVPPVVFRTVDGENPVVPAVPGVNGNVYALVSGKLYPDAAPVRRRVLPILGATTESLMYAHCRAELGQLYGTARLAGMRFHLASLSPEVEVNAETLMSIDPGEMQKLYREGERNGLAGPAWQYAPPDLASPPIPVHHRAPTK
jgi:predicted acylesterase/phospholipase RssA